MNLSFHGAAGTVTGSRHLVRANGSSILVDCGLFQGLKELRLRNWQPPSFDPGSVDHLLLTHAHLDHVGYLPRLVREGFKGPVHCTPATAELAEIMLKDAAHLQEEDAAYANRKHLSKHTPALPLYTVEDAENSLRLMRPIDYGTWLEVAKGVTVRFLNAGHLLGSAFVEMKVRGGNGGAPSGGYTVVFSGDIGGYGMPLHLDPDPRPMCEFLVLESTYGDRVHDLAPIAELLAQTVRPTLEQGGIVLIPAFAVGRSQQVVLLLGDLLRRGAIPPVPVDVNSPMALDATGIYLEHLGDHNLDAGLGVEGNSRLTPPGVGFHRSVAESKALAAAKGPRIIIASSGMLTGGRSVHHLRTVLPDPQNLVLFVGFQAPGTRGRSLLDGAPHVRVHGEEIESRAKLVSLHGLSGHADREEIMKWVNSAGGSKPRHVFLVHGEPEGASALAARINRDLGCTTHVPHIGDAFELDTMLGTSNPK